MCGHLAPEGHRHHRAEEAALLELLLTLQFCLRSVLMGIIESLGISARWVSRTKTDTLLLTPIVQMRKTGPKKESELHKVTQQAKD